MRLALALACALALLYPVQAVRRQWKCARELTRANGLRPLRLNAGRASRDLQRAAPCVRLSVGDGSPVSGRDLVVGAGPTDHPPRLSTSPASGRTFMASVLGLAPDAGVYGPNSTRLPAFLGAWARAWPGLHIEHQATFANHPDLRGLGLAAGTYLALTRSLAYLRDHNATCDYHVIFEDDGVPFPGTTWPGGPGSRGRGGGGGPGGANDLDARLDALEAAGGTALLLGGHRVDNFSRADAAWAAARPHGGIVSVGSADGSYGYIFKCAAMPGVAAHLHARVRQLTSKLYFEQALWEAFRAGAVDAGSDTDAVPAVYLSAPLLVDHAHGFSATWNKTMDRKFEGNVTFWR